MLGNGFNNGRRNSVPNHVVKSNLRVCVCERERERERVREIVRMREKEGGTERERVLSTQSNI